MGILLQAWSIHFGCPKAAVTWHARSEAPPLLQPVLMSEMCKLMPKKRNIIVFNKRFLEDSWNKLPCPAHPRVCILQETQPAHLQRLHS